jgi:hypothetical protein
MTRVCKTCRKEFEGESWMSQCLTCYHEFKGMPRISTAHKSHTRGVFILTHPDVTEEEVNEWITKCLGQVGTPSNWGAVRVRPKMEVWWNCQNTD